MTDIKELVLKIAEEINMKYADLNGDGLPGFCIELCTRFLAAYTEGQEPDCFAVLTPNGSKLVSPEEAKGLLKAYPLYATPQPPPAIPEDMALVTKDQLSTLTQAINCAVIPVPNGTYRYALTEEKPSAIGVAWSFPLYKLPEDLT